MANLRSTYTYIQVYYSEIPPWKKSMRPRNNLNYLKEMEWIIFTFSVLFCVSKTFQARNLYPAWNCFLQATKNNIFIQYFSLRLITDCISNWLIIMILVYLIILHFFFQWNSINWMESIQNSCLTSLNVREQKPFQGTLSPAKYIILRKKIHNNIYDCPTQKP